MVHHWHRGGENLSEEFIDAVRTLEVWIEAWAAEDDNDLFDHEVHNITCVARGIIQMVEPTKLHNLPHLEKLLISINKTWQRRKGPPQHSEVFTSIAAAIAKSTFYNGLQRNLLENKQKLVQLLPELGKVIETIRSGTDFGERKTAALS